MSGPKPAAIDVVVLCLDRLQDTLECIDSVLAQDHPDVRLWVLDQGSEPASRGVLRQRAERDGFSFTEGRRTGVAAGRNTGYRMGRAPVIVALDNDAVLSDEGVLTRVSDRFAAEEALGALAFAVLDYKQGGPDIASWGYPWPVETHLQREFPTARFCGAGHAIARKAYEASPGYDEQLFFFGEELDLSWWLIALGYEIRYAPQLAVRHKTSAEQRIDWANGRYYYSVRNMLYLTRKFFGRPTMVAGYAGGFLLKGVRNGLFKAAVSGIRDGLRLKNRQPVKPALDDTALRYIMKHEFEPRGSAWKRLVNETVFPSMRKG
jgi:GT2 family glycosyltransferase